MGREEQAKQARKIVKRALGDDAAYWALQACVILRRGFWGRMAWLFMGR